MFKLFLLTTLGAIFTASHEDNLAKIHEDGYRWVYFCNNTFGDPFTPFKDPIPCERNVADRTYDYYSDVLARKSLTASLNGGTVNVENGSEVTFISGREIHFYPNFNVKRGAKFTAYIDPTLYKSNCD
jgi:hypothetical protein